MFNNDDFLSVYKGKKKFVDESEYFTFFLNSLQKDVKLFEHIRFCNDTLSIPPIYVFVKYHKKVFVREMTVSEKQGLGACFGYLFQNIWGYKLSRLTWVGERTTGIKNASYFIKNDK